MHIYYPNLAAMERQTRQLEHERCHHCQRTQQLVSHGFVYQKQTGGDPQAVGKRVFCSNRYSHTGCGRTLRLYLDTAVRALHVTGAHLLVFVLTWIAGMSVQQAYRHATGTAEARHAWRWLQRLHGQLSTYRSLLLHPPLSNTDPPVVPTADASPLGDRPAAAGPNRRLLFESTVTALQQQFGQPLCACLQQQTQQSFL